MADEFLEETSHHQSVEIARLHTPQTLWQPFYADETTSDFISLSTYILLQG